MKETNAVELRTKVFGTEGVLGQGMCFLLGKTSCNVVSEAGITGKKKVCAFSKYGSERSRSLTSN